LSVFLSFIVGVGIGVMLGVLLAPTAHFLVGRSEWRRASRELELADQLLENLTHAPGPGPSSEERSSTDSPRRVTHGNRR
jgi:hypothetical protein